MAGLIGGSIDNIGEASLSVAARALVAWLRSFYRLGTLDAERSEVSIDTDTGDVIEFVYFATGADRIRAILTNGRLIELDEQDYTTNAYDFGGTRIGPWEPVRFETLYLRMADPRTVEQYLDVMSRIEWLEVAEQVTEQEERDEESAFLLSMAWDTDRYDPLSPAAWVRLRQLS